MRPHARLAVLGAALLVTAPAAAEERSFALRIVRGKLPSEARLLKVMRGDMVRLEVTADRAVVIHIHGLRVEMALGPDSPGSVTFAASATGRFPIQLHVPGDAPAHHHGAPLAHREVHPK